MDAEVCHCHHISLFCGLQIQFGCRLKILLHTIPAVIAVAQVTQRHIIALRCRFLEPLESLVVILLYSFARIVAGTQVALCPGISSFCLRLPYINSPGVITGLVCLEPFEVALAAQCIRHLGRSRFARNSSHNRHCKQQR